MTFRCAVASVARDDPLAGTASTVTAFLLVENPGPWGVDALRDNRLPRAVKDGLRSRAAAAGVRVLLVRRYRRRAPREGFRVFAAYADPHRPWLETTTLAHEPDLLDLDLAALGAGRSPGLTPHEGTLFCVCTHGRHDACCAERGRPVAAALTASYAEETWECSHIGGDRFAGNVLVLPAGLYYGRLDADSATAVAAAHAGGTLDLEHLRGRSGYAMPVQAAEIAMRRQLGLTGVGELRLVASRRSEELTQAMFEVTGAGSWLVRVRPGDAVRHQLTCRATRQSGVLAHEIVSVTRVSRGT